MTTIVVGAAWVRVTGARVGALRAATRTLPGAGWAPSPAEYANALAYALRAQGTCVWVTKFSPLLFSGCIGR